MGPSIYVKVVGFRDVERHALNTLFRLSVGRQVSYGLWTPGAPVPPQLALIDLDAYEAGVELASPGLSPDLKLICVGRDAPPNTFRTFERPLYWPDVVKAMDAIFVEPQVPAASIEYTEDALTESAAPLTRVSLLVDPSREDRMYLRARLALAGLTKVDDATTGLQAIEMARAQHYDLVIASLKLPDIEGWALVRQLMALEPAIGSVIVTSTGRSWHMQEVAQVNGCHGLIEKPYEPAQIIEVLQSVWRTPGV